MKRSKLAFAAVLLIVVVILLLAVVANLVVNVPVEVKEPLTIVAYPESLSFYPNTTEPFNITVENAASVNYLVSLAFSLNDTTYQQAYVTFSGETHTVLPGLNTLTAWMTVAANAPAASLDLTVKLNRVLEAPEEGIFLSSFHFEWFVYDPYWPENLSRTLDISFYLIPTLEGANLSITAKFFTMKEEKPLMRPVFSFYLAFDYDGDGEPWEEYDTVFYLRYNNETSPAHVFQGGLSIALMSESSPFHVCYWNGNYFVYKAGFRLSDKGDAEGKLVLKNDLICFGDGAPSKFFATVHFDPEGILK